MSIWSRATKKRRRPRTWSGQPGLGQKWCAPWTTRVVEQAGQAAGIRQVELPCSFFSTTRSTAGITSPRLEMLTRSPMASSNKST